ncbi:MAG: hypothetical protein PHV74_12460 [Dehalococcoidia bacterium]|nr:hypothetical protein [Dehalococcoidia bacterium]
MMIAFVMFPMVLSAAHDIQIDDTTDSFAGVTTDVAVTTANVVLTGDLWNDDNGHITSITSSLETDVPVAGTYVAATHTLSVSGLTASETRTLTVLYEADALGDYTGLGSMVGIAPMIIFIGLLFAGGLSVFTGVRSKF